MVEIIKAFCLACGLLLTFPLHAFSAVTFCNKTIDQLSVAIGYQSNGAWVANGWYRIEPGKCETVTDRAPNSQSIYYRATNSLGDEWSGGQETSFCTTSRKMVELPDEPCRADKKYYGKLKSKSSNYTLNLTSTTRGAPEVKTNTIHEKCLMRWHDSHQVHSVRTIIKWNYQAVKTKMKKLEHCIRIKVTGPVDIEGVAKSYVKGCMDKALNDNKVLHLAKLVAGIATDVVSAGATAGAGTIAALTDYVYAVQERAIACLTDTDRVQRHVKEYLKSQFDATVKKESHWVYWDL